MKTTIFSIIILAVTTTIMKAQTENQQVQNAIYQFATAADHRNLEELKTNSS